MEKPKQKHLNVFGTFLETVQSKTGAPAASSKTMDLLRIVATHNNGMTLDELQDESGMPILRLAKEVQELQASNFLDVDEAGEEVRLTSMGENVLRIAG